MRNYSVLLGGLNAMLYPSYEIPSSRYPDPSTPTPHPHTPFFSSNIRFDISPLLKPLWSSRITSSKRQYTTTFSSHHGWGCKRSLFFSTASCFTRP